MVSPNTDWCELALPGEDDSVIASPSDSRTEELSALADREPIRRPVKGAR